VGDDPWRLRLADLKSPYLRQYVTSDDLTSYGFHHNDRWVVDVLDDNLERVRSNSHGTFTFLEEVVAPTRQGLFAEKPGGNWWQLWRCRKNLYDQIRQHATCLVVPVVSKYLLAVRVPSSWVFTNKFLVFDEQRPDLLGIMQSALFEIWVRTFSGSLGETLSISVTEGVNTFPLPNLPVSSSDQRSRLIQGICDSLSTSFGYTGTYNCYHDRGEQSAEIARLRALHVEMDQAVAAAYGWSDLDLGHGFHPTKQGERYTLSESARSTVLDRLLSLNHKRHEEEVKRGLHSKSAKQKSRKRRVKEENSKQDQQLDLEGISVENS
jgi:hypothetical protein